MKKRRIQKLVDENQAIQIDGNSINEKLIKNKHKNGTLISIELENWMNIKGPTKYYFNDGINMITGLNGSGKSSVACGIAISLGYDTHILARGNFLSSYIRNGHNYCRLVIAITNTNEVNNSYLSTIERTINIVENNERIKLKNKNDHFEIKSMWKLNGKKSLEREIIQLRSKLNIQLDNLLTFLAQQRVSHFSNQTPCEIFIETLKIISNKDNDVNNIRNYEITDTDFESNNLLKIYNKFKEISDNSKDCNAMIQNSNTKLKHLENEISKSRKNEIKYIQYLRTKMALELVNFYKSLNDIVIDKVSLNKLNKEKNEILNHSKKLNKELKLLMTDNDKTKHEISSINIEKDSLIRNILNNLNDEYKNAMNVINKSLNNLQINFKDPRIELESYNIKMRNTKEEIESTNNTIIGYKNVISNEWVNKLKKCGLYLDDYNLFDMELAKEKKRNLDENISNLSTKIFHLEREISEFELNISKLKNKRDSITSKNNLYIKDHFKTEYLNSVDKTALTQNKKENIIKFLRYMDENTNRLNDNKNMLPYKSVIGPIGSYITVKNVHLQSLVESFLQQFHYYFVSEREDVKLLTEKHKLNVITLSNSKNPLYPILDDEIKSLGITGFLHEYLNINDKLMKDILYQISPQFYTCAIIDNPDLILNEDEILYKLSNWLKNKYDKEGNGISNNVYLFINTCKNKSENEYGVLYKLVTSLYNKNSKTISMIKLNRKMNTVLSDKSQNSKGTNDNNTRNILKLESNIEYLKEKESIERDINNMNIELEKVTMEYDTTKNEYNYKRALINTIMECISNIPSIKKEIAKLEDKIKILNDKLKSNYPKKEEILENNRRIVRNEIIGNEKNNKSILNVLDDIYTSFLEVSGNHYVKCSELDDKISANNDKLNQILVQIKVKNENIKTYENREIEINDELNNIKKSFDVKKRMVIDNYLKFYSAFYQYIKRNNLFKNSINPITNNIYEYVHRKDNSNMFNQKHDIDNEGLEVTCNDVPGVNYFVSIINNSNKNNIEEMPDYIISTIYEISSEYELISDMNVNLNQIFINTGKMDMNTKLKNSNDVINKNKSLFDLLLDNSEYKVKYDHLFSEILKLEGKTHKTNLERVSELEQEYELLKKDCKQYIEKINLYKNNIELYYNKWLNKLKSIEKITNYCFGTFMKFINERHDGKIIIPIIYNFVEFESSNSNNENYSDLLFNYFVKNFENDCKINIMVRFGPDEDLRLFSSSSISGGEQSLCTILYILSLQGLCVANSFKLYDEINQGLDNSRELKLMELLDLLTDKEKTEKLLNNNDYIGDNIINNYKNNQIIIITPHIFPGIIFNNFSVHFVLNGPGFITEI